MAIETITIAGISIPDTSLVREATGFIRGAEGDVLFHHSRRVFLFGALYGRRLGLETDLELLYVGAMFHDVGLTARYRASTQRFEIDGADAARDFLLGHGVRRSDADKVWLGIALHTTPEVTGRLDPETAMLAAGVKTDVVGLGREDLTTEAIDAVTAAHPRTDFKNRILAAFNEGMKHRPDTTHGTMNDDVLAHFDPTFKRANLVDSIFNSNMARIAERGRQMEIYEALYTTRMMRRLRPDPIPLDTQARILDAAVRAPNGGNTQRWHFLAVDDPELIREFAQLFRQARALEYEKFRTGTGPMVATAPGADPSAHAETMHRMKASGDYLADHFEEIPLLLFVFSIDDLGGANIYPAIWSALLAARAEGVGGVMTMVLRNFADRVNELLGVPVEEGWTMSAMLTLGYPRGKWGIAANRRPVHEVSSRNHWDAPFGVQVPQPLWPPQDDETTGLTAVG